MLLPLALVQETPYSGEEMQREQVWTLLWKNLLFCVAVEPVWHLIVTPGHLRKEAARKSLLRESIIENVTVTPC